MQLISFFKALKCPRRRLPDTSPGEIALWIYVEDLRAWRTRGAGSPPEPLQFPAPGNPVTALFDRREIEWFDPNGTDHKGQPRTGRWLTYTQLVLRWRAAAPQVPEPYLHAMIEQMHAHEMRTGFLTLAPDSGPGRLVACDPVAPLGLAEHVQDGMFQVRQVESIKERQLGIAGPHDVP